MTAQFIAILLALGAAGQARGTAPWTTITPPGAGFTVQAPGTSKPDPNDSMKFSFVTADAAFIVEVDAIEGSLARAVAERNQAGIAAYMSTLRDETVKNMGGTVTTTSSTPFDGHPSVLFSSAGTTGGMPFTSTQRIVVTDEHVYTVVAIGTAARLTKADVDRFHASFKLIAPAAGAANAFRSVSFSEIVCGKIPPLKVRFDVPADFISRAPTPSIEAGCLWGTKDDLDLATADPTAGDFSSLRRGIFYARVSTNVVNSPTTGVFDAMDGSGEAGIRASLTQAGGKVIVWKKETLAGLPALQIVADVMGGRVYMLYLGNIHFSSNAMLLNYYHPKTQSAADDRLWARFIDGIKLQP